MKEIVRTLDDAAQAGFGHEDKDCTVSAMQYAFNLSYKQAHQLLKMWGREDKQTFHITSRLADLSDYEISIQGKYVLDGIKADKGYRVKQFLEEHPQGTYIIHVRGHVFCLKDSIMYDSYCGVPYYNNHVVLYYYEIGAK